MNKVHAPILVTRTSPTTVEVLTPKATTLCKTDDYTISREFINGCIGNFYLLDGVDAEAESVTLLGNVGGECNELTFRI